MRGENIETVFFSPFALHHCCFHRLIWNDAYACRIERNSGVMQKWKNTVRMFSPHVR